MLGVQLSKHKPPGQKWGEDGGTQSRFTAWWERPLSSPCLLPLLRSKPLLHTVWFTAQPNLAACFWSSRQTILHTASSLAFPRHCICKSTPLFKNVSVTCNLSTVRSLNLLACCLKPSTTRPRATFTSYHFLFLQWCFLNWTIPTLGVWLCGMVFEAIG